METVGDYLFARLHAWGVHRVFGHLTDCIIGLFLIDRATDPDVPPLPPHVTASQTGAFLKALWKGDPDARGTLLATAREWWAGRSLRDGPPR